MDTEKLAKRLMESPNYRLIEGMSAIVDEGVPVRIIGIIETECNGDKRVFYADEDCVVRHRILKYVLFTPDLTDNATLGALEGLARELWGDEHLAFVWHPNFGCWLVGGVNGNAIIGVEPRLQTRAEAIVEAIIQAPVKA